MRTEIPQKSNIEKSQNYVHLAMIAGKVYEGNTTAICAACDEKKISGTQT